MEASGRLESDSTDSHRLSLLRAGRPGLVETEEKVLLGDSISTPPCVKGIYFGEKK